MKTYPVRCSAVYGVVEVHQNTGKNFSQVDKKVDIIRSKTKCAFITLAEFRAATQILS
jgi:hypothetical protein